MIPVAPQSLSEKELHTTLSALQKKYSIQVHSVSSGFSSQGVDLGSRAIRPLDKPKALMIIGKGIRSYEAGEVWHLLDTRVGMPITKVRQNYFDRIKLEDYTTLVMVSGSYVWSKKTTDKIKNWVAKGNTIIAIGTANNTLIKHKIIDEKRVILKKDSTTIATRRPYVEASENLGRERLGGIFLKGIVDQTHPLGFGFTQKSVSLYKNNLVWFEPSKSNYGTPVAYAKNPHVDGYISKNIREKFIPKAAPVVVSKVGKGRVVLFAENPNFRGTAYGTNRLFLNALFLGNHISVPKEQSISSDE